MLALCERRSNNFIKDQEGQTQRAPQGDSPESIILREVVSWAASDDLHSADQLLYRLHFANRVRPTRPLLYEQTFSQPWPPLTASVGRRISAPPCNCRRS